MLQEWIRREEPRGDRIVHASVHVDERDLIQMLVSSEAAIGLGANTVL
jgi:hypothetical protein